MPILSDIGPWAAVPESVLYANVSAYAIRLWAVLARHADDNGRCHPSRKRIAQLMRCSDDTVDRATSELVKIGRLRVVHRVDERGEKTSNLYVLLFARSEAEIFGTDNSGGVAAKNPLPLPAISGIEREPLGTREKQIPSASAMPDAVKVTKQKSKAPVAYSPEFERFWAFYPRKTHKGDAWKVWQTMTPAEREKAIDRAEFVMTCYRHHDPHGERTAFIPHPARWLRARGWEDADEAVELAARGR